MWTPISERVFFLIAAAILIALILYFGGALRGQDMPSLPVITNRVASVRYAAVKAYAGDGNTNDDSDFSNEIFFTNRQTLVWINDAMPFASNVVFVGRTSGNYTSRVNAGTNNFVVFPPLPAPMVFKISALMQSSGDLIHWTNCDPVCVTNPSGNQFFRALLSWQNYSLTN